MLALATMMLHVRNLKVRRLQCDEIWNFVGAKAKNVTPEQKAERLGRYVDMDSHWMPIRSLCKLPSWADVV